MIYAQKHDGVVAKAEAEDRAARGDHLPDDLPAAIAERAIERVIRREISEEQNPLGDDAAVRSQDGADGVEVLAAVPAPREQAEEL